MGSRQAFGQLPPRLAACFVKRAGHAAAARQQVDFTAQAARQGFRLRPIRGFGIQMDNRLGIGVHVHHHIGIAGQAQQGEPQHVQLADGVLAQLGQVLAHGGAHQGDIVGAVIAPLPGQPGAHWLGQLGG